MRRQTELALREFASHVIKNNTRMEAAKGKKDIVAELERVYIETDEGEVVVKSNFCSVNFKTHEVDSSRRTLIMKLN